MRTNTVLGKPEVGDELYCVTSKHYTNVPDEVGIETVTKVGRKYFHTVRGEHEFDRKYTIETSSETEWPQSTTAYRSKEVYEDILYIEKMEAECLIAIKRKEFTVDQIEDLCEAAGVAPEKFDRSTYMYSAGQKYLARVEGDTYLIINGGWSGKQEGADFVAIVGNLAKVAPVTVITDWVAMTREEVMANVPEIVTQWIKD